MGYSIGMVALSFLKSQLKPNRTLFLAVFAVALGLIVADVTSWIELDVATVYSLPLILAGAARSRWLLWSLTALLAMATFSVYVLQMPGDAFTFYEPLFLNRVLDVAALLLIAVLLHLWINSMETREIQVRLIRDQNEKLEAVEVSRKIVAVQEAERRTLANHLHDLVGQKLTALSINLNIIDRQLPPGQALRTGARLDDSLQLVEEITESIRGVITELRPVVLDDYGLIPALRWYVEQFSKRTGVATAVLAQGPSRRLPQAAEEVLFRIVQEALANVAKYAGCRKATVALESTPDSIRLTVADDGCGFIPTTERIPGMNHGWGLMIMRERAETVGAQLNVESAPGLGTRVSVQWRG